MELVSLGRVLLAFVFVVGLMLTIAWALRRFGLDKLQPKGRAGGEISCVETLYLDPKRRLVIVKRGNRKHVLLLGVNADVVVESYDAAQDTPQS